MVTKDDENIFSVKMSNAVYKLYLGNDKKYPWCECHIWTSTHYPCLHMLAVMALQNGDFWSHLSSLYMQSVYCCIDDTLDENNLADESDLGDQERSKSETRTAVDEDTVNNSQKNTSKKPGVDQGCEETLVHEINDINGKHVNNSQKKNGTKTVVEPCFQGTLVHENVDICANYKTKGKNNCVSEFILCKRRKQAKNCD
ncbi:hypothetical protein ACF0H5_016819 [Mactra antiquata]